MQQEKQQNGQRGKHAKPPVQVATQASANSEVTTAANERIVEQLDKKIRSRRRWTVVFVIALAVFLVSVGSLGVLAYSYLQGQQKYDALADMANVGDVSSLDSADGLSQAGLKVDWAALLAANPDTVGWVYMPGTAINYPIVKGQDNEYYLTHDFDGDAGWLANYGAIFLDYRNRSDMGDPCNFIFGHHMRDGSMFADLEGLAVQERFDECRTLYVLAPGGSFRLRTFAVVHCSAQDEIVMTKFKDAEEMTSYIQDKIDRSEVAAPDVVSADKMSKIFALATCDSASWGRYVLFSYVDGVSNTDLMGTIGIQTDDGAARGIVDEVKEKK